MEVAIMLAEKNLKTLKSMIPYCKKNISCSKINILASSKLKSEIEKIPNVVFVNEDEIFSGLSFNNVANIIEQISGKREHVGWYLQQFLKLSWAYLCKESSYVVLDSDTFPLNPIPFEEDGKYLFTKKIEYHKPYFSTMNRLFNGEVQRVDAEVSFVAEHMIFDCSIVKELISKIQENPRLIGTSWWEKILRAIDKSDLIGSGFSEFETYGNYVFTFHAGTAKLRSLRTLRQGAKFLGPLPSAEQLKWAARDFDIVSIENWGGVHFQKN